MTENLTENVVYTFTPEAHPAIRYHSIPLSCAGAAETLAEARSSYRADLTGLLHVGRRDLPPVIEHVETFVHGMMVREKVGAVHRDHRADRMFLQTLLAPGAVQDELRAFIGQVGDAGVEPVVVLVESQDTVGSVLDQMTTTDAIVAAYPDPAREVGWTAIYGPEVEGAVDVPRVSTGGGALAHLPVGALASRYRRMRVQTLPHACQSNASRRSSVASWAAKSPSILASRVVIPASE